MKKIWIKDGKFEELTQDQLKGLSTEELAQYDSDRIEAKETRLEELIEKGVKDSEEKINDLKHELAKLKEADYDSMKSQLKAQGVEMAKLIEKVESQSVSQPIGFKHALMTSLKENSEQILKMAKTKSGYLELEVKASQDASDITSGQDFAAMEPGVGQIATRQVFMKSLFPNRTTNKEYVKYNDQETIVRDAQNVAGCAATTNTSKITWRVREMKIEKVRDKVDVCIDMMDDYDFVTDEINNLVSTDVALQVDSQLLLGDNVSPNLNSVDNVSSTFAAGSYAGSIQNAQLIDLLKVAGCQISDFGQNNKFMANYALLNPIDFCKMQLIKDADGNYIVPNWITQDGINIGAMRIIANQLVPENEAYVMDSTKGVVYQRRGAVVEMSFENNDNFEKELVTIKAYERLNFRVRNVDANAFMHIPDIAAAITAITKP